MSRPRRSSLASRLPNPIPRVQYLTLYCQYIRYVWSGNVFTAESLYSHMIHPFFATQIGNVLNSVVEVD